MRYNMQDNIKMKTILTQIFIIKNIKKKIFNMAMNTNTIFLKIINRLINKKKLSIIMLNQRINNNNHFQYLIY